MNTRIIRAYDAEFGPGTAWRDLSRCAFGMAVFITLGGVFAVATGGY